MDLLAYFRALRRRWVLILVLAVVGAAAGVASAEVHRSSSTTKTRTYYKAVHGVLLDTSGSTGGAPSAFTNLDQIALLATTGDVPNAVAKALSTTETGPQLATRITTVVNPSIASIDVVAVDPTADGATTLADTFAAQLTASLLAKDTARYNKQVSDTLAKVTQLQGQKDALLAQIAAKPPNVDSLQLQYDAVSNGYRVTYDNYTQLAIQGPPTSHLSTLDVTAPAPIGAAEYDARIAAGQVGQNHLRTDSGGSSTAVVAATSSSLNGPVSRGVLGLLLGLFAGIGIALVLDRLDRRLRTRDEAEAVLGVPVLAEIPILSRTQQQNHDIIAFSAPLSAAAEAYRAVRSSLLFHQSTAVGHADETDQIFDDGRRTSSTLFADEHQPLVLMVTSASPAEGKTTTSANLAAIFGESGASVLVVNCDFRRPAIHELFSVANEARHVHETAVPGVKLVTNVVEGATPSPALAVAEQRHVIAAARQRFDVIILDTAPLLTANDAVELLNLCDAVLLVTRVGVTTTDRAQRAVDLLTRVDASVVGAVLVGTDAPNDSYYYYQYRQAQPIAANANPAADPSPATPRSPATPTSSVANGARQARRSRPVAAKTTAPANGRAGAEPTPDGTDLFTGSPGAGEQTEVPT